MKLTYRGINYEPDTTFIDVTEGEVAGTFRGQPWHYHYPRHIPKPQPKRSLKYRGVSYNKCVATPPTQSRQLPIEVEQDHLQAPIYASTETTVEPAHLDNIRRNLERRISVAKQQGNEELVAMLEQEFQELAIH